MCASLKTVKKGIRFSSLLLLVAVFCGPWAVWSQQPDGNFRLENHLPQDTIALLALQNLGEFQEKFKETNLYKLWEDEEVQQFLDPLLEKLEEQRKEFDEEFQKATGTTLEEVLELFEGQVALVFGRFPENFKEAFDTPAGVPFLLSVDVGERLPTAQNVLTRLSDYMVEENEGFVASSKEIAGHQLNCVGNEESTLNWTFHGSTALFSMNETYLAQLIDRIATGATAPLADYQKFRQLQEQTLGGRGDFLLYVNVSQLVDTLAREADRDALRILEALGVRDIEGLYCASAIVGRGLESAFYLQVPGERKGIPKLLTLSGPQAPELFAIPNAADGVMTLSYDWRAAWEEIKRMVREIDADDYQDMMDEIAEFEQEFGFSLEQDLLASLGTQLLSYGILPEAGGALADGVYVLHLKDAEKFRSCLDAFLQNSELERQELTFRGQTISYLTFPVEGQSGPFESFALNVAYQFEGTRLYLAQSTQALKRMILRGEGVITTDSRIPLTREYESFGFSPTLYYAYDMGRSFRQIYNTALPFAQLFQAMLAQAEVPIDLNRLPLGETIGEYLGRTFLAAGHDDKGLYLCSRSDSFALEGLMGMGIAAAILIPATMSAREHAFDAMLRNNLWQLHYMQEAYWAEHGEYQTKSLNQLLEVEMPELAMADWATWKENAIPSEGYYFALVPLNSEGRSYAETGSGFAICAWPAYYGPDARWTYLIDDSAMFWRANRGMGVPIEQWPATPFEEGWEPVP